MPKIGAYTTWNVISNLKDLQDFVRKNPIDSKGFTANIPSRGLISLPRRFVGTATSEIDIEKPMVVV